MKVKRPKYIPKKKFKGSVEKRIWVAMISRCRCHVNYAGRGITVCPQWLDSFDNFFRDMGSRPSDEHSIDRRNNDGDYEPDNCRWATRKEQARNTRKNWLVVFRGERLCIAEWAERMGVSNKKLYQWGRKFPIWSILAWLSER